MCFLGHMVLSFWVLNSCFTPSTLCYVQLDYFILNFVQVDPVKVHEYWLTRERQVCLFGDTLKAADREGNWKQRNA